MIAGRVRRVGTAVLAIALVLISESASVAQLAAAPTRITLQSGRIVEGTIVDRLPNGYLLHSSDGSTQLIPYQEVAGIEAVGTPAFESTPPENAVPPPSPPPTSAPPEPARYFRIEAEGGIGYTSVNRSGFAGSSPVDWSQFLSAETGRFLLRPMGGVSLGAEVGHRSYWWYTIRFGSSPVEHDVDAWHFALVARFALGPHVSLDIAGNVESFSDYTDFGADVALRGHIPLGDRVEILVGPRIGVVLDSDANMFPLSMTAALAIKL